MFDKIISFSIKNKVIIGLFVAALILVGTYSLKHLPIDALPDITNNQVQIITTSPTLATQEVELFITYPIELAVKSIPDVVELRSISRFGLSLVTVVFEESTDIYWARAQITERLKAAESQIPEGFGTPELAPISSGLGEIFQYTLGAEPGYEEQFDIKELRAIQDWTIVPQLLGTKGIAEVNTLGGILKEYEVAVNPDKLKSMGITMSDIFDALRKNNENTGGAYIDKKPYAYYIRSIGMVNSLDDVSKIVVKVHNNIPVLIRDVAEVQYGSTVRYGATTRNGQGEVVNGMVMMLKGANSAEVVALTKERIEQIKTTLPKGVTITPYLDRSKLVDRAISTVKTNLIEGALIVLFILVLLIGNWKAGLVVASVIPLALLFAVSMMKLFGVSGNLMSLGAIDFGLIVDGAVIIVEAIVHRLQTSKAGNKMSVEEMDHEVYSAASGIRKSAAFGEIIILIVYLPILALVGIEGKMFTPMAQTVAFAILGAFILSLTYVPMMSALVLSKTTGHKKNLSDRIIGAIQSVYTPVLNVVMRFKLLVIAIAIGLFGFSLVVFNGMGGEFIPILSEGDFATHVMIPPGSSLEQEIATTTKAEQLLLDNFPEVEQVVSKIGSAEVPTDPMPMEVADVMIIMKDQSEWTSASTKEEMFEKMEKVLDDLPGVTTEFSQPIQMRFNELMTGVRSDVGVKIFGENMERLISLGDKAVKIIQSVSGVQDARAETTYGLPQINIKYNKDKLALYGLNVSDLNRTINMGFAGSPAGVVYEGEKKFDLVVRLAEPYRQDISNIEKLYVSLPSGNQIPLGQVADIKLERGPAQVSREEGKRRMIVGFNVRNRDTESVVNEIKQRFEKELDLPTGYYLKYAGQFENLKRAKERLSVAVPISLALIFVLLFFTFGSVKQSVLIFTAIPLSAIGGIFALWLRDMPFSISAGIGFIALFGVAVLNGIVLIGYFNQLKKEGMSDIMERIKVGTTVRLRPVIMTATVASLGFLPMALSTSAGAEVQKPLATVVIGGLLTATLLTLIVLPILYYFVEKRELKIKKAVLSTLLILVISSFGVSVTAQSDKSVTTMEKAIEIAILNNGNVAAAQLNTIRTEQQIRGAYLLPKTEIESTIGQINGRSVDQQYSISQAFNPFLPKVKRLLAKQYDIQSNIQLDLSKHNLKLQVRQQWDHLVFQIAKMNLLQAQDQLWKDFSTIADKKYQVGETNLLEKTIADTKQQTMKQKISYAMSEVHSSKLKLSALLNTKFNIEPSVLDYKPIDIDKRVDSISSNQHPLMRRAKQSVKIAHAKTDIARAEKRPDFTAGYFIQSIRGIHEEAGQQIVYNAVPQFHGVNLGIQVPIFGKGYSTQIEVSKTEAMILEKKQEQLNQELNSELASLVVRYKASKYNIDCFNETTLPNAKLIVVNAKKAYTSGEITYIEYLHALTMQYDIKLSYLEGVRAYNSLLFEMLYLKE